MENRFAVLPVKAVFGAAWVFGAAIAGGAFVATAGGAAWAQDDGGHEDGGHEEGGGKGKGNGGKHGHPVPPVVLPATSASDNGADGRTGAGMDGVGTYLRLEAGLAQGSAGDASWLPPGFPVDPQVFFDLDVDSSGMAAVAIGRNFGNGWRGEVAMNVFASADFAGPWSYTVPETTGPHADVEGTVRSFALMANGYRDFDTGGRATPFVTVGLGVAHNTMGEWTRINPDSDRTRRSFEGGSDTGLAWSVGAGVSLDVGPVLGSAPAKLELAWRYFDLGSVTGGTTPLPGSGSGGNPVEALNFDVTDQVISMGLRIPL